MFQPLIDYFREKSVLILGFGREGRSTYELIRRFLPEKEIAIADMNPVSLEDKNTTVICGADYLAHLGEFDLVMKSPGISLRDVDLPKNTEITCQTELFLRFSGCRCIGITGTKGKTTTSTLTYLMLKEAGIKTCLIGNIGVPVFESLESSAGAIPVIELSSHQLEFMHTSPHIAIMTNLYPEHLDHYKGFEGYARAKLNILKYQSEKDYLICGENLGELAEGEISRSVAQRTRIGMHMWENDEFLSSLAKLNPKLPGGHNAYDISLAATAAEKAGADRGAIRRAVASFSGIPHRMENIGSFRGITFYNDSIATIPQAVKCAVEALGKVDTLIIGGKDRGLDYSEFVRFLASSDVRNIICLPETGHAIAASLEKIGCAKEIFRAEDMEKAVEAAYSLTEKGKICLMSPAASSYNKYKNFEEKGEHYRTLVEQWGAK